MELNDDCSALVILSRSWAGLLLLISCDNGLRAITSQLGASSSSIDMDAQDGILDAFRALLSLVSGVTCKREADRARVLQVRRQMVESMNRYIGALSNLILLCVK